MANVPLTKKRAAWVDSRKKPVLKGSRLNYNASQQEKYRVALETLVKQMTAETSKKLTSLFKSPTAKEFYDRQGRTAAMDASLASQSKILMNYLTSKFESLFGRQAPFLATTMVSGAAKASAASLHSSLKKLSGGVTFNTNFKTAGLDDIMKASVVENVGLIKSIPKEYFGFIQKAVSRSITTGNGLKDLTPALQKYEGVTDRRAKNIALDQTRKAYNHINKGRMQKVGVKKFEWVHSGGGQHPRESHIAMNGQIFSFDDLPVINADDSSASPEKGIPGQAINCKCTMVPVVSFDEDEK